MLALKALGLVAASAKPAGQLAWENLHPRPTRRTAAPAPAPVAAAPAAPSPDPLAKARRRHRPAADPSTVSIDPPAAPSFSAGFRTAVAEQVARLAAGGVS